MPAPKHINLSKIPEKPGVYQFKDVAGQLLYIGKAKLLKNRVSSYFHSSANHSPSKKIMVNRIAKVEFIITSSETEALLLESNQIKRYQPPFNISLKDDKYFLYIKITTNEEFPRVFTVRRVNSDKAKYFGPYVSTLSVRQTLHTLRKLFPHRNFIKPPSKHQLQYYVRRYPELMGPSDAAEYGNTIDRIVSFLSGKYRVIVDELRQKMHEASHHKQYERAAIFRDKINSIERIMEKQKVVSTKNENMDIISIARELSRAAINLFSVRQGKLIAKQDFLLTNTADQSDAAILQTFIERFYTQHTNVPQSIIVPMKLPRPSLIGKTFGSTVLVPSRGVKKQYLNLGLENAQHYLEIQKASWERDDKKIKQALLEFKELLKLKHLPRRIETYDISNIQGTDAVGSMIVFTDGQPDKKWYRKFKIKTVPGANDPAMMAEVLQRRFDTSHTKKGWPQPDLIILDGGKGQLSTVLKDVAIKYPIVALAKKHEDIYLPGKSLPVNFAENSSALFLIQRMRDEAHRFAITFYRKRHGSSLHASVLDDIPGIGPLTKKKLLRTFGTLKEIRNASQKQLEASIGTKVASTLKEHL